MPLLRTQPYVFQTLFDSIGIPIAAVDPDLRLIALNATSNGEFARLYGAPLVVGDLLADTMAGRPDEFAVLKRLWERALAGETYTVEQELGSAAGTRSVYQITLGPLRDDRGRIIGASKFVIDITARLQAEAEVRRLNHDLSLRVSQQTAALRLSEELFRTTFEHAPVGIAHLDMKGFWLRINPRLCEITGYSADELRTITLQDITHPEDREADLAEARRLASGEISSYRLEQRYIRKDGTVVWVLMTGTIVESRPPYFIAVVQDITDRKVTEALLRASEENQRHLANEAERASLAKSRFLAAASHDLRQPAQSLALFASVLELRLAGTPEEKLVGNIMQSIDGLSMLLDSLLDISKLDAGIVVPDQADLALDPLLSRLAVEYAAKAAALGLTFHHVTTSLIVRTDAVLLERILRNMIENALRYTNTGGVLVGCRRRADNVVIEVVDTGIGIAPDQIEAIFEEFHQVGNLHRDRNQGLGLGLAIVRRLAGLLSHPIAISSQLGRGTRISVTLDRVRPSPQGEKIKPPL